MKWPWVPRARLEAAVTLAGEARSRAIEAELALSRHRTLTEDHWKAEFAKVVKQLDDAKAEAKQFMDAYLREQGESLDAGTKAVNEERKRVRAEVRAQEWEAIANELIQKGLGRPRVEQAAQPENAVTAHIRDMASGDQNLMQHWNKMASRMRAEKKTDDEIIAAIGWTTADPDAEPNP